MGIVAGETSRLRLLVACFVAAFLFGVTGFAAETPAPVDEKADAAKKDDARAADKEEEADESDSLEPPAPTAAEIAKRDARAEDYKTLGEKFFKFPVTGSLYTQYTLQSTGTANGSRAGGLQEYWVKTDSATDSDLHQYLTMDFGDPSKHVAVGHFDIGIDSDLNGYHGRRAEWERSAASGGGADRRDYFHSIEDTFGGPVYYRLDSAYVDFNQLPGIAKLRVGRQMTYETPAVSEFDGVRLDTRPFFGDKELVFSFYGGRAAHNYEITDSNVRWDQMRQPNEGGFDPLQQNGNLLFGAHYEDDLILHDLNYGAAVEGRPWEGGRMRFDWQHLTDQMYDSYVLSSNANSDEMTLNLWHTFNNPNVKVNGRVSVLNGNLKETYARVLYYKEDWKLSVSATYQGYYYHQQPESVYRYWRDNYPVYTYPGPLANELDYYSQVLGAMQNYHRGTLVVNKEWTDNFSTEAGVAIHRIAEDPDRAYSRYFPKSTDSIFNRDWDRYYGSLSIHDLPKNFTFTFEGSYYNGKGEASDIVDLNAEASYDWTKQLCTSIGVNWGIYSYDLHHVTADDYTRVVNPEIYVIDTWRTFGKEDNTQSYFIQQSYRPTRWATLNVGYEFEHSRTDRIHTITASFRFDF